MTKGHSGSNYTKGDQVVYHPSKDFQHTSIGTIDKVLQNSPNEQPRFVIIDNSSKGEKVYAAENILHKH